MTIKDSDITFVLQGSLDVGWDVRYTARDLRRLFPGCSVVLATQKAAVKDISEYAEFDSVQLTGDPGALPPVKMWGGAPHNVNRQKTTSLAGLEAVKTLYAVKLRTDSYLTSRAFLDYWSELSTSGSRPTAVGEARILGVSIFTVNPRFDERVSYHISDWFQFGTTQDLLRYWRCPEYDMATSIWYEYQPMAPNSMRRELQFRSRYATEQWLTLHYLFPNGVFPIAFHNDTSEAIINEFEDRLVDNFIIVHPHDISLKMPKHQQAYSNRYFNALCYSFGDWKRLSYERRGLQTALEGYSLWPRTLKDTQFYIGARNRFRWMRKFPLKRVRSWFS